MRIRKLNHSIYRVQYHITWVTKYRYKWLKDYVKTELIKSLYKTQKRHPAWYFHVINTDRDHVHIQIEFPPTYAIATVVQKLKADSSQHLKKKFPFINRIYTEQHDSGGIWSTGYFVSTVGLDEGTVRRYIEMQGRDDAGIDVASEFS